MAGLYGDLSVMSLADVILWLGNREQTGVLALRQENAVKELEIDAGRVIRCSSSLTRERLGQLFLSGGHVTETQLQRAYQAQEETQVLLGRILVMIGLVPEPQVANVIAEKARESLLESILHTRGEFRFDQRPADRRRPEVEAAVHLVEIHRLAALRAPRWEAIRRVLPGAQVAFRVDERAWPVGRAMDALTQRILLLAKTGLTAEAIIGEVLVPEFHLVDRLASLIELGVMEARSPASVDPQRVPPAPESPPLTDPGPVPPEVDLFGLLDSALTSRTTGSEPLSVPAPLDEFDRELERALMTPRRSSPPPPPPPPSGPQRPAGSPPPLPPSEQRTAPLRPESGVPRPVTSSVPPMRPGLSQRPARTPEQRDVLESMVPQLGMPLETLLTMTQSARDRYILSHIDGRKSVGELLQFIPIPADDALETVESLARSGLIVL